MPRNRRENFSQDDLSLRRDPSHLTEMNAEIQRLPRAPPLSRHSRYSSSVTSTPSMTRRNCLLAELIADRACSRASRLDGLSLIRCVSGLRGFCAITVPPRYSVAFGGSDYPIPSLAKASKGRT